MTAAGADAGVHSARAEKGLGVFAPPHVVLLAGLGVGELYRDGWEVAGVLVDGTDLTFLAFAVSLLAYRIPRAAWRFRPYMLLWALLGIFMSLSYLVQPDVWPYLSSPAAVAYQLYRYCWRPLLYYPLVLVILHSESKIAFASTALVLWADYFALGAVHQGYLTDSPGVRGPFLTKNALGSALIAPLAIALATLLHARRWRWGLAAISALLILRALMFSGSRGAFVGAMAACCITVGLAAWRRENRRRIARLAIGIGALAMVVFAARPDILQRPAVQYLLEASKPMDVGNFQWRVRERWPYFFQIVLKHPWFGIGSDVDVSLGERANTPHNGYLALAVSYGMPTTILYVALLLIGVANGVSFVHRARVPRDALVAAGFVGGLVGIMVHNLVESTFRVSFVGPTCWLLVAVCVSLKVGARYRHAGPMARNSGLRPARATPR